MVAERIECGDQSEARKRVWKKVQTGMSETEVDWLTICKRLLRNETFRELLKKYRDGLASVREANSISQEEVQR